MAIALDDAEREDKIMEVLDRMTRESELQYKMLTWRLRRLQEEFSDTKGLRAKRKVNKEMIEAIKYWERRTQ